MSDIADSMIRKIDEVRKEYEVPDKFLLGLYLVNELQGCYNSKYKLLNPNHIKNKLSKVSEQCPYPYGHTLNYLSYIVEKYSKKNSS